jgi:2-keto-4-pentenoate hydratase/2-oxohepta-3-ene-1,7-dioic acid hydratase in catechol pathway
MHTIKVAGAKIVPGKIICVGKNYLAHIREMGGSKPMSEPTIFLKPNSSIADRADRITIPSKLGTLHHEVELCFVIAEQCKSVMANDAQQLISCWGVGLDLTLRDIQDAAKKSSGPWTISKCFDSAAVFGEFISAPTDFDPLSLDIRLSVNGELRQSANTGQMIFTPGEIIEYVSGFMTLEPGDVFMTGTPKGVGALRHGDLVAAEITGLPKLTVNVNRP